jgi:hypothetical protein
MHLVLWQYEIFISIVLCFFVKPYIQYIISQFVFQKHILYIEGYFCDGSSIKIISYHYNEVCIDQVKIIPHTCECIFFYILFLTLASRLIVLTEGFL